MLDLAAKQGWATAYFLVGCTAGCVEQLLISGIMGLGIYSLEHIGCPMQWYALLTCIQTMYSYKSVKLHGYVAWGVAVLVVKKE